MMGMDVYGDMPLITNPDEYSKELPKRTSRLKVFEFLEQELKWSLDKLPSGSIPGRFPRINKESVRAILATLYLNAEVYTGTPRWNSCITQCDAIIEANGYSLSTDYFSLFSVDNHEQRNEMLFYVDHNAAESRGMNVGWTRLGLVQEWVDEYYPGLPFTVWNSVAVEPGFYRKYDTTDKRYSEGFLEGVQYTRNGDTLKDKDGNTIDHKVDFYLRLRDAPTNDSDYLGLYEGVRIVKWEPDVTAIDNQSNNGFPVIRLADIILQKAECLLRIHGDNHAEAINLVNQVRQRCFEPDKPLTTLTLEDLYWERGFELFSEGHRRRDMIRFGTYHIDSLNGDFAIGHPRENSLYPIPQNIIDNNPNLLPNNPTN